MKLAGHVHLGQIHSVGKYDVDSFDLHDLATQKMMAGADLVEFDTCALYHF